MSEESERTTRSVTSVGEHSIADELFSEFLVRRIRGESFDPQEIWNRVSDENVRKEVRRRIENYLHRVEPRLQSMVEAKPDTWFGKFLIERELGRGGMGVVHLAYDKSLNRKVALKVLPLTFKQDVRAVKRFLREAEAAARLRHPNIIPIYSAGEIGETLYYTMEHVPGITLAELIRALRSQRSGARGTITLESFEERGEVVLRPVQESAEPPVKPGKEKGGRAAEGVPVLSLTLRNYVREAVRLFAEVADAL